MRQKKKIIILIIALSILFVMLLGSLYFFYVTLKTCNDEACFDEALVTCSRVYFIKDSVTTIMEYKIQGVTGDTCQVDIKLLQVKKGSADLALLEGKSMSCFTKLGVFSNPESDLSVCHGILKEEIQDMIIKRMHTQIVENLGKISEETTKVL